MTWELTNKAFVAFLIVTTTLLLACNRNKGDDVEPTFNDTTSTFTVTVGVYIKKDGKYTDQNKDFVFVTGEDCQTWSRTAGWDRHSLKSHNHYNAASDVVYNTELETVSWSEYGPEKKESKLNDICSEGSDGVTKNANKNTYSADKKFFLKIKAVE